MILSGMGIQHEYLQGEITIDPWDEKNLNPASYDLTLGDEVATYDFGYVYDTRVDPEPCVRRTYIDPHFGIVIRPGIGYLMHTRERVSTKKYVPVLDGKSSIGRLFISVHQTAGYGDPGFDGQYTLEVTTLYPIRLYAGMKIAQIRFHVISGSVEKHSLKLYEGNYVGEAARGPIASRAWKQFPQ